MSESDQRQQLVDKIHWTNNTISVFKREVEELKRKRKKAIESSKQKKQKNSCEVAKYEAIIKSLGLSLSRHAKELERISLVCVNSPTKLTYTGANEDYDKSSVEIEEDE